MKILFKFCVLAIFSCILTCFIEQSNATCNGTTLAACEQISANCVWANNACTAPANGACWGKNQTTCGVIASGSNSYWCHWTYNNGVSGDQSCMTFPTTATAPAATTPTATASAATAPAATTPTATAPAATTPTATASAATTPTATASAATTSAATTPAATVLTTNCGTLVAGTSLYGMQCPANSSCIKTELMGYGNSKDPTSSFTCQPN